jgi:polyhydroxybutyrate depolymerase
MSGQAMFDITAYHELADREGFIVAYPDGGVGLGPWNVGEGVCGAGLLVPGTNDDQAFIDALIEFADVDRCLDREHVFVTGFSMGGYFSNETGCLRSDIAAIGPHSGGSHPLDGCSGGVKPVIVFHFQDDGLIDYACGVEAAERWAERNGCDLTTAEVRDVQGGSCEYYSGCPAQGQVALCSFQTPDGTSGHGWSGGKTGSSSVPGTASATELGWEFFKEFAW